MFNKSKFNKSKLYQVSLAAVLLLVSPSVWAQQETGFVAGTVFAAQSGNPVAGAFITVDGELDLSNVSDSDGNFAITLAPGEHVLGFSAEGYSNKDITVNIVAGQTVQASTLLNALGVVTSIDVVATVDAVTATAEALLVERKLAAVVSDSVGREELSQGTAGDAAGALEKVTGVSVVGQGFVYVRGLGERYSATQLNGAAIPTTEPEKRVVPLDLFPTGMIDNIKVSKTYNPDLPAEFSGGMVQLETMEFPNTPVFNVSVKSGFNSVTSFNEFLSNAGGGADYWGFGSGDRQLPAPPFTDTRVDRLNYTSPELETFGEALPNVWDPQRNASMRPGLDWSLNGGGSLGKLGIVGGVSFSNQPQLQRETQRYLTAGGGGAPRIFTEYPDFREYTESARLGGVFNLAYRFSPSHKIVFRNTLTHDTDNSARQFSGTEGSIGSEVQSTRLRYIERNVLSTGIEGEHVLSNLMGSIFNWQFTYSNSSRDEPDLREIFRIPNTQGALQYANTQNSSVRFFSDMQDRIYEPKADWSIPFFRGNLVGMFRFGGRFTMRRRDFAARRFRFFPRNTGLLVDVRALPTNQIFAPENIGPNGFELLEFTRGTDSYDATMDVNAGYAMIDLSIGSKWRIVGGLRVESAVQEVVTVNTQIPGSEPVIARLENTDPAPGVNLIYSINQQQNLRVSYSRTLSRPDFRELSPFDFNNIQGGFVTVGNANLQRASIQNFDVRWEMFPGGNQLIAVSAFYKDFTDPIEQVIIPSADLRQSYVNAQGARNLGVELEFRQDLGAWAPPLQGFSLGSNFTFVDSNIELSEDQALLLTSQSRPLLGQSRYVFNGTLGWVKPQWNSTAQFTANYVSRKITDVGAIGVPDIYQEPNAILDFVYSYTSGERGQWTYQFEAENITNNHYHWTQGPFTQRLYQLGRTFQVGVSYSFY